jgi:WD40 repeat protein
MRSRFACLLLAACFTLALGNPGQGEAPPAKAKRPPAEKKPAQVDRYGDPLPPAALARLGTYRLRQDGHIASVAFSPDGKAVASTGHGSAIHLWDLATGKELRRFTGHKTSLKSVDFSADGKTLIGGADFTNAIYFWDVATGRLLRHLGKLPTGREILGVEPANQVRSLGLTSDGKTLATPVTREQITYSPEGGVISHKRVQLIGLWDIATGKQVAELGLKKPQGRYVCVSFSRDGKTLVSAQRKEGLHLWSRATGKLLHHLEGHKGQPLCAAFSPDGKTLASGGKDTLVILWDTATGKELRRLKGHESPIRCVLFTPDCRGLISASRDLIRLWNVASGQEIRRFKGHDGGVASIALSSDGKRLAAGVPDGAIILWDVATGKPVLPFEGHRDEVCSLAFSPDGTILASGGDRLHLWSVRDNKTIRRIAAKGMDADAIAYAPDGKRLACASWRMGLQLWDTTTGKELRRIDCRKDRACKVSFAPDGVFLVSRHESGLVRVWDPATGKLLRRFGERLGQYQSVGFSALSPDGKTLAVGGPNGTTQVWRVADGKQLRRLGEQGGSGFSAAFSPDGKTLATADTKIQLWDLATGKELRRMEGHEPWVFALVFSPDARMLASAGSDEDIRLWEVATGQERRRFRGHRGGYDRIRCLAFSPDGKVLASGGEDTTILLWGVTRPTSADNRRGPDLTSEELTAAWTSLAGTDTSQAYEAMCRLMQSPGKSLPFLGTRLKPVPRADPKQITRLIRDLESKRFAIRSKATRELEKLEEVAEPALSKVVQGQPGLEVRQRVERLLQRLQGPLPPPERLRALRALEVFEHAGPAEARRLLTSLAQGAPAARLTQEAKAALKRLARRPARTP